MYELKRKMGIGDEKTLLWMCVDRRMRDSIFFSGKKDSFCSSEDEILYKKVVNI